jgi:hypothetical protein
MDEAIQTGKGSREPGKDPTITLEMYNELVNDRAKLLDDLREAKRQLRERDSIISDMDRRTKQLEESQKRAADLLLEGIGWSPKMAAQWEKKRDKWIKDAGFEKTHFTVKKAEE